ncbi:MAG: class I SAM-dependent DNA methyltransferase [Candidatus Hydrogenedentes bacterium]|nr:class I SAM-dependent DNA methyltransferase [Candidatus Hydrogenedentota bacterium]
MTIQQFIAKWRKVELKERSAAQEHFIDLCNVFGHPTPAMADPTGESFCFEKGAAKHGGGDGFADVWKRGFFGMEYKGKHKDLDAAYDQLLRYRDALENPPLLIVCDLDRITVHTNFTGTVSASHEIALESLADPRNIEIMRAVFHHPETLRPGRTSVAVTQEAARHLAEIADALRRRGLDPAAVAHFLDRIVFCMFAEDIGLLPDMVFTRLVGKTGQEPARFSKQLGQLFEAMAEGGDFGLESVRHFNGNLFDDRSVLELTDDEIKLVAVATNLDWSAVDPSIFGTLFERGLDPAKRAQLGAHFTSREDIELVVDAVVMVPLRREWAACRESVRKTLDAAKPAAWKRAKARAESLLHRFLERLRSVKILDPACGSGNFLYVALLRLKDLEKEAAVLFPSENGLDTFLPGVNPSQLYGIEINTYAHDLAQMTVWIGWLQWIHVNGFGFPNDPVLRPLSDNIRLMDAIVDAASLPRCDQSEGSGKDAASTPQEPDWPDVDFIIGNPPFLGNRIMPNELGEDYVSVLFRLFGERLGGKPDLCCYWFEKARTQIKEGKCQRAGLLATQGIRGGTNRNVLKRIKESGDIFWAESDRPWVLNGANVHVSMIGFDDGTENVHILDGRIVDCINANLTTESDTTAARKLSDNLHLSYQGSIKRGPFDFEDSQAIELLREAGNPTGRPNSDVVVPYINGIDVTRRQRWVWIVDFANRSQTEASLYEAPYKVVETKVRPERQKANQEKARIEWWLHWCQRPEMMSVLAGQARFITTPRVSKHRLFVWQTKPTYPDCQLIVFACSDDYFFGVLHSRFHEVWALAQGTQLREKESGFRYTPTTCFETFPFPCPNGDQEAAIGAAAKELNELRENWLNPPEWTRTEILAFPGTVGGPWHRYIDADTVTDRGAFQVGTVRYPRLVARDAECAVRLKDRTLTKLYNARPAWLAACHERLDAAVAAAYGWPANLADDAILERLLALNVAASNSDVFTHSG